MEGRIDRRGFLAGAGAAGLAVACGSVSGEAIARAAKRSAGPPIRGQVIRRGAPGFLAAAHVYNERFDGVLPTWVARPIDAGDVVKAVSWGVANHVPLRARSGGHSYAGYSTLSGGMVLDLRNMRGIGVDVHNRQATIGAGAQLIDVYAALAARGMTIPAGSCPSVGIAGHALGGGMGLAGRRFGLTADNLVSAQIVTADGRLRTVSSHTNPDLYWGLRGGGGGNFGVVTSFTFRIHPVPSTVAWFIVEWPFTSGSDALGAWQAWAPHAGTGLTSIFHLNGGGVNPVRVTGQYFGPASDLGRLLAPLTAVGGATVLSGNLGYLNAQLFWAGCSPAPSALTACHTQGTRPGGTLPRMSFQAKSDYVATPLPAAARDALVQAAQARAQLPGSGAILFDSYGGAINQVAPDATAFVHRRVLFCVQYLSYGGGAAWLGSTAARMRPYVTGGAYFNYTDPNLKGWQTAYWGSNYPRLVKIQREVDPHHYFNFPQAIGR
ncbi:MAG TPA: FAD-binding oxidoreductase [Solirubrobacteraceae bacterium]|nr:FAD-binding oxidoreductase [Solirubrobacteraceae bacterium]